MFTLAISNACGEGVGWLHLADGRLWISLARGFWADGAPRWVMVIEGRL
jgi:hypothetical protein